MTFRKLIAVMGVSLLLSTSTLRASEVVAKPQGNQPESTKTDFISAEELKAKIARNEPLTIIDVRSGYGLRDGDNKIRNAVYVKLRRLKSRLAFPPLKDVSRSQEAITYCACPNDESSIRAAQVLLESGFKRVRVLKGGWMLWQKANGQVQPLSKVM